MKYQKYKNTKYISDNPVLIIKYDKNKINFQVLQKIILSAYLLTDKYYYTCLIFHRLLFGHIIVINKITLT